MNDAQISRCLTALRNELVALRQAIAQGDRPDDERRILIDLGLARIADAITQTAAAAGLVRR
jgi:hypothetical protein